MDYKTFSQASKLDVSINRVTIALEKLNKNYASITDTDELGKVLYELIKYNKDARESISKVLTDLLNKFKSDFESI